ncbi:chitinase [Piscinibacter terrae]|uniref:chitinase n=1 Tax=Piscinibacter terrae TaxID=2496871 RepID=UPI001F2E3945|nr:chitinase [Albitalea terrae]
MVKGLLACGLTAGLLAGCGGGSGSADSTAGAAGHVGKAKAASASCNAVAWAYGQFYPLGTVVQYSNGGYYKLVNVGANGSDGTDPTISTWYWSPSSCSGGTTGPTDPSGFPISEDQFRQMFPSGGGFYTYAGLVAAARAYPEFAASGSDTTRKQEAAAFLANVNHETGGLVYVDEINTAVYASYCHPELPYGCPAGVDAYHGRGPIQLSHNYNYKAAGDALSIDLLNHPEWVSTNPEISWKTGVWFWMSSTGAVGTTPHNAMVSGQGFGTTIQVINGGLECNGANPAQVQSRVDAYRRFTGILGVPPGEQLGC